MEYCRKEQRVTMRNLLASLTLWCEAVSRGSVVHHQGKGVVSGVALRAEHHRGHMYTSIMWQHIKCVHIDMLARVHADKHQRCHTKTGIQTEGRDSALLLQSSPSFWGKIGSPASFPIFPPQLSFNQPMQMLSLSLSVSPSVYLSICLSFYLFISLSALTCFVSQPVICKPS